MTEPDNERPIVGAADCGVAGGDNDTAVVGLAGQAQRQIACEVYSRVVGYLRPTQDWGPGKRAEFADRKVFDIRGPKYNMAGQ